VGGLIRVMVAEALMRGLEARSLPWQNLAGAVCLAGVPGLK
jgi:hypothetical protein